KEPDAVTLDGKGVEGRFAVAFAVGKKNEELLVRRVLAADQTGRQDSLAIAVEEPIVRLKIDMRPQAENNTAATAQMHLQPAGLAGAQLGNIAQENAVIRG